MGIVMKISQQFNPSQEDAFMLLEKKFHQLELGRLDYPKGKRMQPLSAQEPLNTLIWQYEFKDLETAYSTLNFFKGDEGHEVLFREQVAFIKDVKIEFYKTLDFDEQD
jgi:hypothetical protein